MKTLEELKQIVDSIEKIRGWDFSQMKTEHTPAPWEYTAVARQYLKSTDHVLDIGTGGGEIFLSMVSEFESGIGVDQQASMIATAKENLEKQVIKNVSFQQMEADDLMFEDNSFDVVLLRHLHVYIDEIVRVLRPGGYFVTQAVSMNTSIDMLDAFGWTPLSFGDDWWQPVSEMATEFKAHGCHVIAEGEFDIPFWFKDVESCLFYIMSCPWPERIDLDKHWQAISQYLENNQEEKGFKCNEHRGLLVVQKAY